MNPLRILLVDDSDVDLMLAEEAFAPHADTARLTTCTSGDAALASLRDPETLRPDVVVLDVNMPGLTGFQVLEALKTDPALQAIPVVMLSTSGAEEDVSLAYTLHASSYLVKARTFPQFVSQVEEFLTYWHGCRLLRRIDYAS